MYRTATTWYLHFDRIHLVTSDDFDLTRGFQGLRSVPRSVLDTIHVISSVLLQPDTATLPGESSDERVKI